MVEERYMQGKKRKREEERARMLDVREWE